MSKENYPTVDQVLDISRRAQVTAGLVDTTAIRGYPEEGQTGAQIFRSVFGMSAKDDVGVLEDMKKEFPSLKVGYTVRGGEQRQDVIELSLKK